MKSENRLTAIKFIKKDSWGHSYWMFRCSCGNNRTARIDHVKASKIQSCGCLGIEIRKITHTKHGMRRTRIYSIWSGIIARTKDKNNKNYGAKGITVCKKWLSFENFLKDMSSTYKSTLTIDRIDNSEGYNPNNCRWATQKEQQNNRSNNIKFKGETVKDANKRLQLGSYGIQKRITRGWTKEQSFTSLKFKRIK